jgi:hypothetical protein
MPTAQNDTNDSTISVVETAEDIRRAMIFRQAVLGRSYRTLQSECDVSLATLSQILGGSSVVGRTGFRQITVVLRLCKALGIQLQIRSPPLPTGKLSTSRKKTTNTLTSLGIQTTPDGEYVWPSGFKAAKSGADESPAATADECVRPAGKRTT